jgi:hypothetical protein
MPSPVLNILHRKRGDVIVPQIGRFPRAFEVFLVKKCAGGGAGA